MRIVVIGGGNGGGGQFSVVQLFGLFRSATGQRHLPLEHGDGENALFGSGGFEGEKTEERQPVSEGAR